MFPYAFRLILFPVSYTHLMNFVVNICGCETKWTAENIIEDAVARIKEQVGNDEVILGLSGGVDSSVVALLLHRAIGKNLHCVFVDNGLLRLHAVSYTHLQKE